LNATKLVKELVKLFGLPVSQFPLWDFFECNKELGHTYGKQMQIDGSPPTLNSLCGISVNATQVAKGIPNNTRDYNLSIPFVGFR
jgi:hypothetical protein